MEKKNGYGLGVAGMVLGICGLLFVGLGLLFGWFCVLIGVICAVVGFVMTMMSYSMGGNSSMISVGVICSSLVFRYVLFILKCLVLYILVFVFMDWMVYSDNVHKLDSFTEAVDSVINDSNVVSEGNSDEVESLDFWDTYRYFEEEYEQEYEQNREMTIEDLGGVILYAK